MSVDWKWQPHGDGLLIMPLGFKGNHSWVTNAGVGNCKFDCWDACKRATGWRKWANEILSFVLLVNLAECVQIDVAGMATVHIMSPTSTMTGRCLCRSIALHRQSGRATIASSTPPIGCSGHVRATPRSMQRRTQPKQLIFTSSIQHKLHIHNHFIHSNKVHIYVTIQYNNHSSWRRK